MRRLLALVLCLTLLLPLFSASTPSHAADSYLITIAEDLVLDDISDNGMAVYIDGLIYTPYTTLQKMNSVFANYNPTDQVVTVYRVGAIIYFDLQSGIAYDQLQQRSIRVPAKIRGGVPYLPISIVTSWMGMYFSFISAENSGVGYPVIRLASDKPVASDSTILLRNAAKMKAVAKARDKASGIVEPTPPEVLPERTVSLMFAGLPEILPADENGVVPTQPLASLLNTLSGNGMQAVFFFGQADLLPQAETLRELMCRGFPPGILLTDAEDPLGDATACSQLYAQLLHQRVRLVCPGDVTLTDEQRAALQQAGFVVWTPTLAPDTGDIKTNKLLSTIQKALRSAPEISSLQLRPTDDTAQILPVICSYLLAQNFTAAPIYEWTMPY